MYECIVLLEDAVAMSQILHKRPDILVQECDIVSRIRGLMESINKEEGTWHKNAPNLDVAAALLPPIADE